MRVAGLLTALTGLTIGVHTHGWVTGLDAATMSWFVAHRSAEFDSAVWMITDLANPAAIVAAALICGALLSRRPRSVIRGVVVIATVGAASLAKIALNAVVVRPRTPVEMHLINTDHPFPSGHVAGTAALLGIIAVCVGIGRSRATRAWLTSSVVAGVLVVALTRLYVGAHWLTDVIGGAVLAGVFVTLGAAVIDALGARSGEETTTTPVKADRVARR